MTDRTNRSHSPRPRERRGDPGGRTRRGVLALGTGALGALAGCLGGGTPTDEAPADDGTPTDTPGTPGERSPTGTPPGTAAESVSFDGGDPLGRTDGPFARHDVGSYYLALLSTAEQADAFPTDRLASAAGRELVSETDYGAAAVVVFQDRAGSSSPDLERRSAAVDGRTVSVDAAYPGEGATADVIPNTLVARVPTETGVDAARVTLHPQYGDPIRVATLSAYDERPAFGAPGDLVVRNRDCASARLSVAVAYEGDLFFRSGMDLDPASLRRVDGPFARAGEWTVAVRRGDRTVERTCSLSSDPLGDVLVDVAGDGRVSLAHRPTGVDAIDPGTCATDGYPYESSDPAANLATPVDLWVLDRSDGSHRLSVTVRDGGTEVFSDEFDTGEGYDKAKRAGLLAKKTDYTVAVSSDSGRSLTETVTVAEGAEKLVVRVTEAGELAVSVE